MRCTKTWSATLFVLCFASQRAEALLVFKLSSELVKPNCANDDDGDCLDNYREQDLAWILSPNYFYDEDEECAGAWYTQNPDPQQFGRRDFFQVRPSGNSVNGWKADANKKYVHVTYFLLHPHDCLRISGHQGDSEHVQFRLYSYDLKQWYLAGGWFHHHGRVHWFSGAYLQARAQEIGTHYPNVAADEDSHGSWPGRQGSSSHCADGEDSFCIGTCDCFKGTMASAFANRYFDWPSTQRNIGGPAPELWRPSVVRTTSTGEAYTVLDVGHGSANLEWWTPRSDRYRQFCGWECAYRTPEGNCRSSVHGRTSCCSPLSEKTDKTYFALSGSGSSTGGGSGGGSSTTNCFVSGCPTGRRCCGDVCVPGNICP